MKNGNGAVRVYPPRRCVAPDCSEEFVPRRQGQVFCSAACKQRAYRARPRVPEPSSGPQTASGNGGWTRQSIRRSVTAFLVPDGIDEESRRVLEYVNAELARWNAGERGEPVDLILEAAKDRLRRHSYVMREASPRSRPENVTLVPGLDPRVESHPRRALERLALSS